MRSASSAVVGSCTGNWISLSSCGELKVSGPDVNSSSTSRSPTVPVKWNVYSPGRVGAISASKKLGSLKLGSIVSGPEDASSNITSTSSSTGSFSVIGSSVRKSEMLSPTAFLAPVYVGSSSQPTTNSYGPTLRLSCASAGGAPTRSTRPLSAASASTRLADLTNSPPYRSRLNLPEQAYWS